MESVKDKYKLNIIDKDGQGNIVDLVYGASAEEFVAWLKLHGRIYVPFYKGLEISPDERSKEIALVEKTGNLSADLVGAGEKMEFDKS